MAAVGAGGDGRGFMGAREREASLFAWEVGAARDSPAQWAETLCHELMRRRGAGEWLRGSRRRREGARVLGDDDTALPKARVLPPLREAPVSQGGGLTAARSSVLCSLENVSSKASSSCKGFCWAAAKPRRAPAELSVAPRFFWPLPAPLAPSLQPEVLAGRQCSQRASSARQPPLGTAAPQQTLREGQESPQSQPGFSRAHDGHGLGPGRWEMAEAESRRGQRSCEEVGSRVRNLRG